MGADVLFQSDVPEGVREGRGRGLRAWLTLGTQGVTEGVIDRVTMATDRVTMGYNGHG